MENEAINPANGKTIRRYDKTSAEEAYLRIGKAHDAFGLWRSKSFTERAAVFKNISRILRKNNEEYSRLITIEMGKPIRDSRAEVEKCAWVCEYFGEHAEEMLKPEPVRMEAGKSYVSFHPLGVVLAIMPWNYPFWQVFRFAAPALMAGNAAVLKHASNVPGCSLAIEKIMDQAGAPENLFRSVLLPGKRVEELIEHPLVRAVTLTGSTGTGRGVAAHASRLLKKSVLELGGSDPYVVLEDADLEKTVEACVAARLLNSGQSCIAAKRFVVVEAVRNRFEEMLVERMKSKKMGDPLDEAVEIGPMARPDLRQDLHRQVRESIAKGADCLLGGEIPQGEGNFYPATVLTNVRKGMPAYDEETFGPVAAVISVRDETEAVLVANDTRYGLGAAVFTRDIERGEKIARDRLEAGSCFVNAFVKSDPRLPFGGIKESGYGRELSAYGIKEFVNIKTVYLQ
ncbi:MAG: NAD-dependent succinate-semialdehyde dehydrogenase [Desulfobacteraceae bacterium]|nr:MAG: NAD-dependent succinate-semialdehyde dehydrogenase [Desulfobacteraceae bacterium]